MEVCLPGPGLMVRYERERQSRELTSERLSTKDGDLAVPNAGNQQTASLVLDVDQDGVTDFVITERTKTPSVVWYRLNGESFDCFVIENTHLSIEAGGDAFDIDGDGDPDIQFCGDSLVFQVGVSAIGLQRPALCRTVLPSSLLISSCS